MVIKKQEPPRLYGVISNRGWLQGESPAMAFAVFTTEKAAKDSCDHLRVTGYRIEPIDIFDDGSKAGLLVWRNRQTR